MLQGDLATLPLPDLFQWVDAARRSGVVEVEPGTGRPSGWRCAIGGW